MKRKQIGDERLAALLTEAYDAHLDAVLSGHCEPETHVADTAIPTPPIQPGRSEPKTVEAPIPIRSTSVRRARWQGAAAAILVLTVLGAGGWLLHRQLRRLPPAPSPAETAAAEIKPQKCHAALLNGETVYVLDDPLAEYEGEYDLQTASTRMVGDVITEGWPIPEFTRQAVLSYADYAAYCQRWGLEQTYSDPEQNYLVCAWGALQDDPAEEPRLTELLRTEQGLLALIRKPRPLTGYEESCVKYPVAWVLTVPVANGPGQVETATVLDPEDYAWEARLTAVEEAPDGSLRITGWQSEILRVEDPTYQLWESRWSYSPAFLLPWEGGSIGLLLDGDTMIANIEFLYACDQAGVPPLMAALEQEPERYRLLAEGCVLCEEPPEELRDQPVQAWYHVGTLTLQTRQMMRNPAPKYCHAAELGGETVYVLDDEEARYEGEYDLQEADLGEKIPNQFSYPNISEGLVPEDYLQQTVMSYPEYVVYCEKMGLEQKYQDPNQNYLVFSWAYYVFLDMQPCLIDLVQSGQMAYAFVWNRILPDSRLDYRGSLYAWVLTIPTDRDVTTLEVRLLQTQNQFESKSAALARDEKNRMETLSDGSLRIVGYANRVGIKSGEHGAVPAQVAVSIGGETACVWTENAELLNPDGTPLTDVFDLPGWWNLSNNGVQQADWYDIPYCCFRAEGCERIEDREWYGKTDEYPDYRAARVYISFDEDPDKAFDAVQPADDGRLITPEEIGEMAEAFLLAHPGKMKTLAETVLSAEQEDATYQYTVSDNRLECFDPISGRSRGQIAEHPILDASAFLSDTTVFDSIHVSDRYGNTKACVFSKTAWNSGGWPLFDVMLIYFPEPPQLQNGHFEVEAYHFLAAKEVAPNWYLVLEPMPDGQEENSHKPGPEPDPTEPPETDPAQTPDPETQIFTKIGTGYGQYLSPWGEEYVILGSEGFTMDCLIRPSVFVGRSEDYLPYDWYQPGFYAIDRSRNILIRIEGEWSEVYRKASLPPFDRSVDNAVRLELIPESDETVERYLHVNCGSGITDPSEIAAFLSDIRTRKINDLSSRNAKEYGVIYAYYAEEPALAFPMRVFCLNNGYAVSIGHDCYVLPEQWIEKLLRANHAHDRATAAGVE